MRVFDRYLGVNVPLPQEVEPERYQLLKCTTLNGDIELNEGAILVSDGRERCSFGHEFNHFFVARPKGSGEEESISSLVTRSINTIANRFRASPSIRLSPLIPSDMAELAELNELDKELIRVIESGHLDEIARRPCFSMKYEADMMVVSRVQRMAPGAVDRLAAHSEDWHRRTISGVLPNKLLALLSEDDWSIYENHVFVRLLDRLDSYVRNRLSETEQMHEKYREALDLTSSESIDYRLRRHLCELWGDAMTTVSTEEALQSSEQAIQSLRQVKHRIGFLRQSDLYKRVPRSVHVPAQLRHTNILLHDQHYRHLRTLWHLHQIRGADKESRPREVFEANSRALADFTTYIFMLMQRVLASIRQVKNTQPDYNEFIFAGMKGAIIQTNQIVILKLAERELAFVPTLCIVHCQMPLCHDGSGRILVNCLGDFPRNRQVDSGSTNSDDVSLEINPFDFYCEEKLRIVVERFLWTPVFAAYGCTIGPMPLNSLRWLDEQSIGITSGKAWRLIKPPTSDKKFKLLDWLTEAGINQETKGMINLAINRLEALSVCRHCGNDSIDFVPRSDAFMAVCPECNTEWGIYHEDDKRVVRMTPKGVKLGDFQKYGSWFLEFFL